MGKLIKRHSQISIKKVAFMGLLLSLFLIFSFISQILKITIFPIAPFLKLEFVAFMVLVSVEVVGIVWATVLAILVPLLRLTFDPDLVGILALLLAYICFAWFYFLAKFCFKNYLFKRKLPQTADLTKNNANTKETIFATVIAVLGVSLILVGLNYAFIIRLYILYFGLPASSFRSIYAPLVGIILAFNLITYAINTCLFLAITPVLNYLHLDIDWNRTPSNK